MCKVYNIADYQKYIGVVACCDHCEKTWIAQIKVKDFKAFLEGKLQICPSCGAYAVYFCDKRTE